jgi:hypothetical protein
MLQPFHSSMYTLCFGQTIVFVAPWTHQVVSHQDASHWCGLDVVHLPKIHVLESWFPVWQCERWWDLYEVGLRKRCLGHWWHCFQKRFNSSYESQLTLMRGWLWKSRPTAPSFCHPIYHVISFTFILHDAIFHDGLQPEVLSPEPVPCCFDFQLPKLGARDIYLFFVEKTQIFCYSNRRLVKISPVCCRMCSFFCRLHPNLTSEVAQFLLEVFSNSLSMPRSALYSLFLCFCNSGFTPA